MRDLSEKGRANLDSAAARQGIDPEAAFILLVSLSKGGGHQARFNHPALGGMGQWSQGAMTMIGDVSNNDLKHRLDALCFEFTGMLEDETNFSDRQAMHPNGAEPQDPHMKPAFFQRPDSV